MIKTNVMRILDKIKAEYEVITYDVKDDKIDGISVSKKIGREEKYVYKTLVTKGISNNIYIFLIPVREEIDFKKVAKVTNEKRIEMLDLSELQHYTGYIRGGCSPIVVCTNQQKVEAKSLIWGSYTILSNMFITNSLLMLFGSPLLKERIL
ncbi:YbaK/EbsC family protein [Clostridium tagluense]|uniref:YbaK/EbsC family protein n=1 Tax=Clostridium tagluense TaxID=360422 RepID=UPI000F617229|nr:YbaK/EbsC family protein [Clostridium tagluense]